MSVCLSIDLDYWPAASQPERFFRKVFNLGLPIFVDLFHDQLLDVREQHRLDPFLSTAV